MHHQNSHLTHQNKQPQPYDSTSPDTHNPTIKSSMQYDYDDEKS